MVSYFVPRGRFLIRAGNLRQAHQKHQQPLQQQLLQQQQPAAGKWPMLRHLRQTFCTKPNATASAPLAAQKANALPAKEAKVAEEETLIARRGGVFSKSSQSLQSLHRGAASDEQQEFQRRSAWRRWAGFLLRLAPVGLCVFGVIEWQLHRQKCERQQLPRTASEFQSKIYCSLPLRIMSRCWGWLAACYVPVSLRPYIYGWYSNAFGVNLEEAEYADYKHYNSLSEFFTRPLRDGVRNIDANAPLVSPADGKVLHFGSATNSLIEQVKGVNYNIEAFLGPADWRKHAENDYAQRIKEKNDGSTALFQCVIYLAPGDYHRFHSPTEWQPILRRHFAGELLSVSPKVATWLPGLFCLNERALYLGKWAYGFFSYTAVGATNVGSVQIYMDEKLKTNRWVGLNVGAHKKREQFDELSLLQTEAGAVCLKRGDLVGQFNMGSTIVLLFEAPTNFEFNIQAGQKIRVGEALGHIPAQQ